MDYSQRIKQAVTLIKEAKRITAFTGAGVSTESGISDFRSPGGVWDRYRIVTFQEFLSSHDARVEYWSMKKELFLEMKNAKPNKAHLALAGLEKTGNLDPRCDICNGFIKPATISFGQPMPEKAMLDAYDCASRCDLFLMAGSSLQVEPAASIPGEAYRAGAKFIFVNRTETPYDRLASVLFRENTAVALDEIVEGLRRKA